MMTKKLCFAANLLAILIAIFCSATSLAQDPAAENEISSIDEQTIYIPYEKLKEVFERDGRGVFLPYEKFQQLWNEARKNQPNKKPPTAPLGALITDIESTATLGKEIVSVDAKIKIELIKKGWHRVPLRLAGAAIRRATIDGVEARIVSVNDGRYELLVSHEGKEPAMIELELSYAKSLTKSGGQSTVAFNAPQAPVNRWSIRTGQKDIDVQIEPMIASSKKDNDDEEAEGDEILAFVGAAPEVKINWTPKAEGASGLAALVSATTTSRFQIDQGVARTSVTMVLDVSRAEIDTVSFDVPADQKVVSVFDRNVKKWNVAENDENKDSQTVTIELFEPALGRQSVEVELEKFIDEIDDTSLTVPQIRANDVSRNSGVVLVNLSSGLRAEPESKSGLSQLDAGEIPKSFRQQAWEFAYRYAALPFELALKVKKIQPLINVDQLVEVSLRPEKLKVEVSAIYDIQLAGVFQLDLDVPKEFNIREIRPLVRNGLTSVPVDTFYRDPKNENRVLVTLGRKAIGKIGLFIVLDRELDDANLLSPTDVTSDIEFTLPKTVVDGVEFSRGNLIVNAPESLQVNAAETKGLRNESFQNALARHETAMNIAGVRPILSFSFSHTAASIKLQAKRRRPQVTAEQIVIASVQSGVVKYDASVHYDVQYSGVKSLRLDVPTALVDKLRNRSDLLQQDFAPQPADVPDGHTAWKITGDNEFFGSYTVRYTWEEEIANLPLGESIELAVERLIPAEVDRANGQIVLTKSETIDVRPNADATGLRPIDPQTDLLRGTSVENAAMAFEFVDDWKLSLMATRFELQDLKRTSISRAVVRAVALRQDELSVQCLYQMRSVSQRIAIQMPAGFDAATSFDDQPIRVNGRRVTPERGGKDLIYIPLTGQNSDEPFLLEIRYTIPGTAHQIDLPLFTDQPAVQKVYLCVYLPFEKALFHKSGAWTDEAIDQHNLSIAGMMNSNGNTSLSRMFRPRRENVDQYLTWVNEGVNCESTSQKFEVDGRPYVFSALRPDPAPDGSLHLRSVNMTLLNVIVCGLIGLLGLILIPARLTTQIAAALLALAALVAIGLFFPLVTEHLFSEALLLTAGIVALTWLVTKVVRWTTTVRTVRGNALAAQTLDSASSQPTIVDTPVGESSQSPPEPPSSPPNSTDPPSENDNESGGAQ